MERLKGILADKILDISSGNGEDVKSKIDKIQRFRDFANACQTLMKKYPAIEDELINMVEDGDFDTKVASSRVDTVIRLADNESDQNRKIEPIVEPIGVDVTETDIDTVVEEIASEISEENAMVETEYLSLSPEDIPMEIIEPKEENLFDGSEYNDFEEIENTKENYSEDLSIPENDVLLDSKPLEITDNPQVKISDFEENWEDVGESVYDSDNSEPDTITSNIIEEQQSVASLQVEEEDSLFSDEEQALKRKATIKRVIQVAAILLAVVAIIFIVKFVMLYWQTILIIIGILAVLAVGFFWFKRKC